MRVDGPLVSCLLTAGISFNKIILLLLCVICPTPCIVQHLIYVHMHVLMDPTKITIPTLARIARLPPPPPLFFFFGRKESVMSMLTNYKTQVHWGAGCLALRTRNGRLKNSFSPGGTLPTHPACSQSSGHVTQRV